MPYLWNASTTLRNSRRIQNFLTTVREIEGEVWDRNIQVEYQCRLIRNRYYKPKKIPPILRKTFFLDHRLTLEDARIIFEYQHYEDPPMRGRTSISPLKKLGLVELDRNDRVRITELGRSFLNSDGDLTIPMLEWHFCEGGANVKPFIVAIKFIYGLDEKRKSDKGVTYSEFGNYIMTITDYKSIDEAIYNLINNVAFELDRYINYANYYDYLDNNLRYFNQSKLFIVSNNRIKLNYSERELIEYILNNFDGNIF